MAAQENPIVEIHRAMEDFDVNAPLSDTERAMLGEIVTTKYRGDIAERAGIAQEVQEIEGDAFAATETVAPGSESDYNTLYAHYLKCQSIATLIAFREGWSAFEELVLKAYLLTRQREDRDYRGEDPHRALALRIRKQEAEDFVKFIRSEVEAAAATPKPTLK
jgi:hypothetical protein